MQTFAHSLRKFTLSRIADLDVACGEGPLSGTKLPFAAVAPKAASGVRRFSQKFIRISL